MLKTYILGGNNIHFETQFKDFKITTKRQIKLQTSIYLYAIKGTFASNVQEHRAIFFSPINFVSPKSLAKRSCLTPNFKVIESLIKCISLYFAHSCFQGIALTLLMNQFLELRKCFAQKAVIQFEYAEKYCQIYEV